MNPLTSRTPRSRTLAEEEPDTAFDTDDELPEDGDDDTDIRSDD